ncbi:MAG: hypothetical protein LUE98_03465 [Tannerellaceae bacterium]|nr:hypothetical protein [Tannerellaceae bacterium]
MNKQLEDIKLIREMMERSSKFVSLSGLSGIIAGLIALSGTGLALYMFSHPETFDIFRCENREYLIKGYARAEVMAMFTIGCIMLVVCLLIGVCFSYRKSRLLNQTFINKTSLRVLYHMAIPLATGGIVTLLLVPNILLALAMTLIFYGLALFNVSKFTYDEIHYLGLTEIILGVVSLSVTMLVNPDIKIALIFWGIGFGICHIIYGTTMYIKYDRNK